MRLPHMYMSKRNAHTGMSDEKFRELAHLFFSTRQIIRQKLPQGKADPNGWLRFETLHYIADQGGPTMQDVAGYVRIKAPSVTSLIGHLVRLGLVEKRADSSDKRIVRLYPTRKGTRTLRTYAENCARTMREVFSRLPSGEVVSLAEILRRLRDIHRN